MRDSLYSIVGERARAARADYNLGLAFYHKQRWNLAARHFSEAVRKCGHDDVRRGTYLSYQGLCQVYGGDSSGLNLCRHAAAAETLQARVFVNLALAELKLNHRKRACLAVSAGLRVDRSDPGLLRLRDRMGVRRAPVVPFLKRDNLLNRWLGRYTWQRLQASHGY
jgi:hypothetical protein